MTARGLLRLLPLRIRAAGYALRGGFLIRPLLLAVVLGAAGAFLSSIEEAVPLVSAWVPQTLFPSHEDPGVVLSILGVIATSAMTVVSIVFAILLMTLTLASMQFSPRILISFARDRTTQWTLGIFLGTFAYCVGAMPAARTLPHPVAPVATAVGAMVLALLCCGWLLFFIQHISQAISVNHIVDRIARETELAINELMPERRRSRLLPFGRPPERLQGIEVPMLSEVSGYIRFVDTARLVAFAKQHRLQLRVTRKVGQFVPPGVPLLMVSRRSQLDREHAVELTGAFDIGPMRTLQQDVEFGVIQIVDIALRAISPAVNDPSTAISCIDQLTRLLIRWLEREPPEAILYDPPQILRVVMPWMSLENLLDTAIEQIRAYATGDVAVSRRLLRLLRDVASTVPEESVRARIVARGRRVVEGCRDRLPAEDIALLEQHLGEVRETNRDAVDAPAAAVVA